MITIQQLKAFLVEIQTKIKSINFNELVVDDSQLTRFLEALETNQNFALLGIIPEYPLEGTEHNIKWNNKLMFMVLQKTASRDIDHKDLLDIFEKTLEASRQIVQIIISEKSGENGDFCGIMNNITESSVRIYPIWNKAQCNGWGIDIDMTTNF